MPYPLIGCSDKNSQGMVYVFINLNVELLMLNVCFSTIVFAFDTNNFCIYIFRFFTGTALSTFSYRIQEEREILGFKPDVTFNRLCGDKQTTCEQPAKWTIKY